MRSTIYFLFLSIIFFYLHRCSADHEQQAGQALAEIYCGNCHLTPSPKDLPQDIWINEVLPKMGAFYGVYEGQPRNHYLESPRAAPYLQERFPKESTIDSSDWAAIKSYYYTLAPDGLSGSDASIPLDTLTAFDVHPVLGATTNPVAPFITLLAFDEENRQIITGGPGRRGGELQYFSSVDHTLVNRQKVLSTPSVFDRNSGLVLEMGSLLPSDHPRGSVSLVEEDSNRIILDTLARPVDMLSLDLNQDGSDEIIVAEYGNMVGQLAAYHPDGSGGYTKQVLLPEPGALRLRTTDLDEDGHEDLIVLFAQGRESIRVFYSRPDTTESEFLLQFPPSYGSSDLELIDWNGDGRMDLLYTSGDNFDYQPIPKPYHGARIFLNEADGQYREILFYPMDGAYDLEVADFDLDGDYDLALIAYFVPPLKRATQCFVYLEQTGDNPNSPEFRASTYRKPEDQHYLRLTRGDVDADGDQDLLIANFAAYLPDGMRQTKSDLSNTPVYIWLENLSR